jgi:hypothetical protein
MSQIVGAGEIEVGEVAEKVNGLAIISPRCVYFNNKPSETNMLAIEIDLRHPLMSNLISRYALVTGGVIFLWASICSILAIRSGAEVVISIIQMVAIGVIWELSFWTRADNLMHRKQSPPTSTNGDESITRFTGAPIKYRDFTIPVRANERIEPLCERNNPIRLVKRLLNSVTLHVAFHGLSEKEIMRHAAALDCLHFNRLEVV